MQAITLFEHQARSYAELGWRADAAVLMALERLNAAAGSELIRVSRHELGATQHVGVLRVGDVTIEVLPKIDWDPHGDANAHAGSCPHQAAARSATRNLLYMLAYTHGLGIVEQDMSPLLARRSNWFELLTRLFARELCHQVQLGIEHSYVSMAETTSVIRGRWELARQLGRRPHVRHRFDVTHDEFSSDTVLNRAFGLAVKRLLLWSEDRGNQHLLRAIAQTISEVDPPTSMTPAELSGIHFHRLNERFRPAFGMARLFLQSLAPELMIGDRRNIAFMLDMNQLFEQFVGQFVVRHRSQILPASWADAKIHLQSAGRAVYLAESLPDHQPSFRLIPDIVFSDALNCGRLIIDTKYKQLDPLARRYRVSESDMYQMVAYATRLDCPNVLLLYPAWSGAPNADIEFRVPTSDIRIRVATINLHQPIERPSGLISELGALIQSTIASSAKE
ncbi:MAG: hypothetical protein GX616_24695 [Planctomycetes bacterium]|nr:hypothetical protein [Planctomycetota bacterium]